METPASDLLKSEQPLPPLPDVAFRLLRLVGTDAPVDTLAAAIASDAAVSARVLRLANSVALRGGRPVADLNEACLRIGQVQLRQLVLGLVFVRHFPRRAAFDYKRFWRHSLYVALASEALQSHVAPGVAEADLYTSGLLHDIGIPLLNLSTPTRYREIIATVRNQGADLLAHEREVLGVDHEQAAAHLLGQWALPGGVVAAARHHSAPAGAPAPLRPQVAAVHLADRLARWRGHDHGIVPRDETVKVDALVALGLPVDAAEAVAAEIETREAAIEEILASD
jgi:two-component system cell cycle response regulator